MIDQPQPQEYKPGNHRLSGKHLVHPVISIVIGAALAIIACYLLVWNESAVISKIKKVEEAKRTIQSITLPEEVDPQYEGQLLHITETIMADEKLSDSLFHVSVNGIALKRQVEMFQWVEVTQDLSEEEIKAGKKPILYKQFWSEEWHDPTTFQVADGHDNPAMPIKSEMFLANNIMIAGYQLGNSITNLLIESADVYKTIDITEDVAAPAKKVEPKYICTCVNSAICGENEVMGNKASLSKQISALYKNIKNYKANHWSCTIHVDEKAKENTIPAGFERMADGFYRVNSLKKPEIGDIRVRYKIITPQEVTIIGTPKQEMIEIYQSEYGTIASLIPGAIAADVILVPKEEHSLGIRWTIRIGGVILVCLGLWSFIIPARSHFAKVPMLGMFLGLLSRLSVLCLGISISFGLMAQFWWLYRPHTATTLSIIAAVAFAAVLFIMWQRRPVYIKHDDEAPLA